MEDIKEISNLELFYDVLDDSIDFLYEKTKENYLTLIEMTLNNIIQNEILNSLEPEDENELMAIYERLESIDFNVEDVRKAIHSIILKGFKEVHLSNGETTPDTIGIFITYLIDRLRKKDIMELNILDPLCGIGNLLFTVINHLENINLNVYGIDHNKNLLNLCKLTADLLDADVNLYLQDTFNVNLTNIDFIITDIPQVKYENDYYMPYDLILKHKESLNDKGYMICVIPNDFFDYDKKMDFKKNVTADLTILGIIELPSNIFVQGQKSILLLKKEVIEDKKCLMVKLPSFSDVKEFNKTLMSIEAWFEKNIK